jgi:hypothetical protein
MVVTKRDNAAGEQPNRKVEWLEGAAQTTLTKPLNIATKRYFVTSG